MKFNFRNDLLKKDNRLTVSQKAKQDRLWDFLCLKGRYGKEAYKYYSSIPKEWPRKEIDEFCSKLQNLLETSGTKRQILCICCKGQHTQVKLILLSWDGTRDEIETNDEIKNTIEDELEDRLSKFPEDDYECVPVYVTCGKKENLEQDIEKLRTELVTKFVSEERRKSSESETQGDTEYFSSQEFSEGRTIQALGTRYERDIRARQVCLEYYGYRCQACEILLTDVYGEIAEEFIHVHHREELSLAQNDKHTNPIADLVPVCPNCHNMLHRKRPAFSVEELAEIIQNHKKT